MLYILHSYSYAACTQFLFALNNDFLLQASEPGCALSAPKLGHPVLHTAQLQEPSLLAQVFSYFRSAFFHFPSDLLPSQHLWAHSIEGKQLY